MEILSVPDNTEKINITKTVAPDSDTLPEIKRKLEILKKKMSDLVEDRKTRILQLDPAQQVSCENLLSYLALRTEDIRDLQASLHMHGLSSLASSESHIFSQINLILERLGDSFIPSENASNNYTEASKDIRSKSKKLFGEKKEESVPYIMVTLDKSYAENHDKVRDTLMAGMNVARINCAHDDEYIWERMIIHLRRAAKETHRTCKIYMDLAGPKIRTLIAGRENKKRKIEVAPGETIYLTDNIENDISEEKIIGCTIEGIVQQLKKGERVLFDDGSIECRIEEVSKGKARLTVVRVSREKPFIKPEKGMNFPDSDLSVSSLTDFDISCLPFIAEHADLIGYSFIRNSNDLVQMQKLLSVHRKRDLPVILKIETKEAVRNLPSLLIQGMQENVFGVMIARGDLAIELGFERMSEIQEEILWICEAAHAPVIWATQVLETLNKTGLATRSEITDAFYSGSAECVMINKGEHTIEVIKTLKDILLRGGAHHIKKRHTFRPLQIAKDYLS
jgi:pyruvate kinase